LGKVPWEELLTLKKYLEVKVPCRKSFHEKEYPRKKFPGKVPVGKFFPGT
jgi:hypothetical protein